jgi:predicted SAM-dependent methyltransferase
MAMKAHLGCWHRFIPGFIHVDLCDMPHINYKNGIDCLPFFSSNSLELIYCSHAFEYFDRDKAREVLKEWWRVLEPGGTLRLAVPDFRALIGIYEKTGDLSRILGPLYGKFSIDTEQGPLTLYHKTTYDQASLSDTLEECGFIRPHLWDWRQTEHANIDDHSQAYFPHMQKDTGILVSLNLQAYKPKSDNE